MKSNADNDPNLEQITQLLNAREIKNVSITNHYVSVTVSPQLELLSIILTELDVPSEYREALQRDIVEAVNLAMREVVTASTQMLEGLQELPEIQSLREALQKMDLP